MPDLDAIDQGFEWEKEVAKRLGMRPQPGSGNHFTARMDIADLSIVASIKDTRGERFYLRPGLLEEVVNATIDPGAGASLSAIPMLIARVGEYPISVMRLDDQLRILTEDIKIVTPSKADVKRATAAIPPALRGD